jgi:hypothetical protein
MQSALRRVAVPGCEAHDGAVQHSRDSVSINSISQTIDRALTAAGLNTKTGVLKAVTTTIEKALALAGLTRLRRPIPGHPPAAFRASRPMAPRAAAQTKPPATDLGQFLSLSYSNGLSSRAYKLYIPSSYVGESAPLIVMLHGCKQNPDDFATGTPD